MLAANPLWKSGHRNRRLDRTATEHRCLEANAALPWQAEAKAAPVTRGTTVRPADAPRGRPVVDGPRRLSELRIGRRLRLCRWPARLAVRRLGRHAAGPRGVPVLDGGRPE